MLAKNLRVETFAHERVPAVLGYKPVLQAAPMREANGSVNLTQGGYLGQLLAWGTNHRQLLQRVLVAAFDNAAAPVRANQATNVGLNCTQPVNIFDRTNEFLQSHAPNRVFRRYLVKPSAADANDVAIVHVPRYNPGELQGTGDLSDGRKASLVRGFERMERVHTAMMWIKHIKRMMDEIRAAPAADRTNQNRNALARYLFP